MLKHLPLFRYGEHNVDVASAHAVQNMLCLLFPYQKLRLVSDLKFPAEGHFANKENRY
jgi:hypothetical protein